MRLAGGFWLQPTCTVDGPLATTDAYARVWHPQYVAFVLIMFGFLLQWLTILAYAAPRLIPRFGGASRHQAPPLRNFAT